MKKSLIVLLSLLSIAIYTNENNPTMNLPFPSEKDSVSEKEEVEVIEAKEAIVDSSDEKKSVPKKSSGEKTPVVEDKEIHEKKENSKLETKEVPEKKVSEPKIDEIKKEEPVLEDTKNSDSKEITEKEVIDHDDEESVSEEDESDDSPEVSNVESEPNSKSSTEKEVGPKKKKIKKTKKKKVASNPSSKNKNSKKTKSNIKSDQNPIVSKNSKINKLPDAESEVPKKEENPVIVENSNKDTLPNQTKKKKNDKETDEVALGMGPYVRGNYHLNRKNEKNATANYNISTSSEGNTSNKAKLELIRLMAKERNISKAKNIIESIQDVDTKFKGFFELASGLENSAKSKKDQEESLNTYLYIITEAPREDAKNPEEPNPLLPKASFATGLLLYKMGDYLPALDHLSNIIMKYKNSEYVDDAIYLSGRIYEEGSSGKLRNLERAKQYYKMFLDKKTQKNFRDSIYLKEVEKRFSNLNSTKF